MNARLLSIGFLWLISATNAWAESWRLNLRLLGTQRVYEAREAILLPDSIRDVCLNFADQADQHPHYEYRLDGLNERWTTCYSQTSVVFANLSGGAYTFRVRNQHRPEAGEAFVRFSVEKVFWQRWWFGPLLAGYVLLVAGVVGYLFAYYRLRQRARAEAMRNRIARDLHDDLGTTLSHVNLLSVLSISRLPEAHPAREGLLRIGEEIGRVSEALDDIVWNVNPQHDSMGHLLARMRRYAGELLEARGVALHLDFPEPQALHWQPDMAFRRELFLIFKELITNLGKHAQAREAQVTLRFTASAVSLSIRDNGLGFDPGTPTVRNGLKNLRTRVENRGGTFRLESVPGAGTQVEVWLARQN